ncbi:MAG: anhydro-N-acetylmuramic acid kinase [Alphaproteobacteria bacterium]|nr:anhydro-N-acetylmuramic acid kinase [Alphaproteobacteria bacterium]
MSKSKSLYALGLMSGTSMDGVDAALLRGSLQDGTARLDGLGAYHEIAFDPELRQDIAAILGRTEADAATRDVEKRLGVYYRRAVTELLHKAGLSAQDIDLIGLHGQTITHRPENGFTWQLGDGVALASATKIPVVYDFRQQDMRNGGQGAPLAPVFHQTLAQDGYMPALPLVVVNIGGISNITALGTETLRAYDSGPGNSLMDDYCQKFLQRPYDKDGAIAATGSVDTATLQEFMCQPYFSQTMPKSLDRSDFCYDIVPHLAPADALRTLTACAAAAITKAIDHECLLTPNLKRVLIAGGGRHNITLLEELAKCLPNLQIEPLDACSRPEQPLNGDAIEAWAFAWLAILNRAALPASFPTTTGVATPQPAGVYVTAGQG